MKTKVIVITFRKGGSGKTSSAFNIAAGLSKLYNKKVLLIDMDPQASLTLISGIDNTSVENTIMDLLFGKCKIFDTIHKLEDFDIIPANKLQSIYAINLQVHHILSFKNKISDVYGMYDYIVMDSPPGESLLTQACLISADYALLSVEATAESYDSLWKTIHEITEIKQSVNHKLEILGIYLNLYDKRLTIAKLFKEEIMKNYSEYYIGIDIMHTTKYKDAAFFHKSIFDYDKQTAADGYKKLVEYIYKKTEELSYE